MIAFYHISKTANVGDTYCTPKFYFPFPDGKIFNLDAAVPPCDALICGGGAIDYMLRGEKAIQGRVDTPIKIAWGVGASVHRTTRHPPAPEGFDLTGVREFGREGGEYVPCVTCMSPLFDRDYEIRRELSFFVNFDQKIKEPDVPAEAKRYNNMGFEETIEFIASGETLVTNSYHGAYWATLLKRKVICIPYSSKFHGFKFPPVMASSDDWKSKINEGVIYTEALEDCRAINVGFHEKVQNLLAGRAG